MWNQLSYNKTYNDSVIDLIHVMFMSPETSN